VFPPGVPWVPPVQTAAGRRSHVAVLGVCWCLCLRDGSLHVVPWCTVGAP